MHIFSMAYAKPDCRPVDPPAGGNGLVCFDVSPCNCVVAVGAPR
jgi:hypothetical protein